MYEKIKNIASLSIDKYVAIMVIGGTWPIHLPEQLQVIIMRCLYINKLTLRPSLIALSNLSNPNTNRTSKITCSCDPS